MFDEQKDLYLIKKKPIKPINLTVNELKQWIGLVLYFSISKLPNIQIHWNQLMGPLSEVASGIVSRNHFEVIKTSIHLADNSDLEEDASKNKEKYQ